MKHVKTEPRSRPKAHTAKSDLWGTLSHIAQDFDLRLGLQMMIQGKPTCLTACICSTLQPSCTTMKQRSWGFRRKCSICSERLTMGVIMLIRLRQSWGSSSRWEGQLSREGDMAQWSGGTMVHQLFKTSLCIQITCSTSHLHLPLSSISTFEFQGTHTSYCYHEPSLICCISGQACIPSPSPAHQHWI